MFIIIVSVKKDHLFSKINELNDFEFSKHILSDDLNNGIFIDEKRNKICLVDNEKNTNVYRYRDILEVEILEDGSSVTKMSRTSQVGGAILGGLILGPVGAIIGGLSGKKENINKVNRIDLKLIVNNTQSPLFIMNFLDSSNGEEKGNIIYKTSIQEAREWHSLISVLIKKADFEDNKDL